MGCPTGGAWLAGTWGRSGPPDRTAELQDRRQPAAAVLLPEQRLPARRPQRELPRCDRPSAGDVRDIRAGVQLEPGELPRAGRLRRQSADRELTTLLPTRPTQRQHTP